MNCGSQPLYGGSTNGGILVYGTILVYGATSISQPTTTNHNIVGFSPIADHNTLNNVQVIADNHLGLLSQIMESNEG